MRRSVDGQCAGRQPQVHVGLLAVAQRKATLPEPHHEAGCFGDDVPGVLRGDHAELASLGLAPGPPQDGPSGERLQQLAVIAVIERRRQLLEAALEPGHVWIALGERSTRDE